MARQPLRPVNPDGRYIIPELKRMAREVDGLQRLAGQYLQTSAGVIPQRPATSSGGSTPSTTQRYVFVDGNGKRPRDINNFVAQPFGPGGAPIWYDCVLWEIPPTSGGTGPVEPVTPTQRVWAYCQQNEQNGTLINGPFPNYRLILTKSYPAYSAGYKVSPDAQTLQPLYVVIDGDVVTADSAAAKSNDCLIHGTSDLAYDPNAFNCPPLAMTVGGSADTTVIDYDPTSIYTPPLLQGGIPQFTITHAGQYLLTATFQGNPPRNLLTANQTAVHAAWIRNFDSSGEKGQGKILARQTYLMLNQGTASFIGQNGLLFDGLTLSAVERFALQDSVWLFAEDSNAALVNAQGGVNGNGSRVYPWQVRLECTYLGA